MAFQEARFGFDPVAAFLDRDGVSISEGNDSFSDTCAKDVPHSIAGLSRLSRFCAWAAVLDLSNSLLAQDDNIGDESSNIDETNVLLPHERLECAAYRILALLQTRQVERAANSISQFGDLSEDSENYHYESFPQFYPPSSGRSGSFVPFSLRALTIEIRLLTDADAIEDLYALRRDCATRAAETSNSSTAKIWHSREAQALSSIALAHLRAQQHDAAVDIARTLTAHQGSSARALYMYARVLLHVGDIHGAREVLARADERPDGTRALRLVHEGLVLAADGAFLEASAKYDAVAQICAGGDKEMMSLWAFSSNNSAICLLHLGRLKEAVQKLEMCLRENPRVALDEGIVVNIATLYDLAFPDTAVEKKAVMKSLASKYGRQGFDLSVISDT